MKDFFSRLVLEKRVRSGSKEDTIMKIPIKKSIKRFLVAGILVSIGLPVIIIGGKKLFFYSSSQVHTFFTPEQTTLIIKGIENKELRKHVERFITKHIIKKSLLSTSPSKLIIMLQEAFPVIKTVTYQYQPPKTIVFTLEGTKPACLINDQLVMGDHFSLIDKKSFTDEILVSLPKITIEKKWLASAPIFHATTAPMPRHLYNFIHKITPYVWQHFAITYRAPWHIELIPYKSICKARILTTELSFFDTKKMSAISNIFKDLCSQGIVTKKVLEAKHCPLIFDTRIKNQIIVRCNQPAKRGRGHG